MDDVGCQGLNPRPHKYLVMITIKLQPRPQCVPLCKVADFVWI